jgi:soluble lytic murein transglycosylase-like protein
MLSRLGIALCLLGLSVPARAQIYSWRDADGNLVLSNKQPGDAAPLPSYTVPKGEGLRTIRSAVAERARSYDDLIAEHSRSNGVRPALVRAVMQVESGFNPYARSPKGAMGLMQLMPATARQYAVADPFDPASNIEAGIKHLKSLLQRLPVALALAAYNAGEGAVQRFNGIPPYPETRNYVSRILALANR